MSPLHQRYLETVRKTQWLAPDQLLNYQARLLEDIARHAYETVPFYRDRLAPLFRDNQFDPRGWRDVPILNRADVLTNGEAMRALSVPLHAARDSPGKTSGTTGPSLQFDMSELANMASQSLYERMLEAHGIDCTAHQARIRLESTGTADYPEGSEERGWSLSCSTSRHSRLNVHSSIAEQADWLARRAPAYLSTYQSNAGALARHFEAAGGTLKLRGVFTLGETVDAANRDDVRRVFGCNIIDSYGATEVGYLAFQCPEDGGYHVCLESALLELVDADGNDVEPGQRGQIVLTPFYNFAMPFIRYAIGDFAIAGEGPCPCGRTLPRLAEILGRQRNIFSFPDGSQYSPWKWRGPFSRHLRAKQFQIVQTALDRIELRYVPQTGAEEPDANLIEEIGRNTIHPQVLVHAVPVAEIPRTPLRQN